MKTKYILWAIILLLGVSCSKNDEANNEPKPESSEMVTVSLALGGEINTSETPLSRAGETESTNLYGVQIYEQRTNMNYPLGYAAGIFDNVADMKINLYKDAKYQFIVTLIKNGKNLVQLNNWGYGKAPFNRKNSSYIGLDELNMFTYGTLSEFKDLGKGTIKDDRTETHYPEADRFYGELSDYTPEVGGTATIELKRTAFGLKYEIENLTDGSISLVVRKDFVVSNSSKNQTLIDESGVTESETEGRIFTFYDVRSVWLNADNDYSESINVEMKWLRGNNIEVDLGNIDVLVKRNKMNILKINLAASDSDATIGITTEDDSSMTGDEIGIPLEE